MRVHLTVLLTLIVAATTSAAESVDDITAKNLDARGGAGALAEVKTVRVTGHLFAQGMNIPYTLEWKHPDKVRFAYETHPGSETVQTFDGTNGWKRRPHSEAAERLTSDELSRLLDRCADLDGALVRARADGSKVRLVGRVTIDGREAYKLAIQRSSSDVIYEYVDTSDLLVFRRERTSRIDGAAVEVVSSVGDYRKVDGVLFAHSIESKLFGSGGSGKRAAQGTQAFVVETLSVNVKLDDSRFGMQTAR